MSGLERASGDLGERSERGSEGVSEQVEDQSSEDESGWETCDDSECVSEWESESEADMTDEPVYSLECMHCSESLCVRGMKVLLVADTHSAHTQTHSHTHSLPHELFSTDIPSLSLTTAGTPHPIDTCSCTAEQTICGHCSSVVGYHVLQPCAICSEEDHNSHYWMFHSTAVNSRMQDITWGDVTYNGSPHTDADTDAACVTVTVSGDRGGVSDDAAEVSCCICASTPIFRPTRVSSCGHIFCFGCVSREVDARGRCPLDRLAVTRDMLQPVDE